MPLARWKDLCLDVTAPAVTSPEPAFWAAVLDLVHEPDAAEHGDVGRLVGVRPGETVWLNAVPEPRTVKNRVHLDVFARAVADVVALGATPRSTPGRFAWTVMADPEGQEFCVFVRDELPPRRVYELGIDSLDPAATAGWWQQVLGGETRVGDDFHALTGVPDCPFEAFAFAAVPEPKTTKNRVHWDVVLADGVAVGDLLDHGATLLRARDPEIGWDVLADPEGNEFCAFRPG